MKHEVAQVPGVLAERVVLSTPLDPWLTVRALADYSSVSPRTPRGYLLLRLVVLALAVCAVDSLATGGSA